VIKPLERVVGHKDVVTLFSNLEQISSFHKEFLHDLEDALYKFDFLGTAACNIGNVFLKMVWVIKLPSVCFLTYDLL